MAAPQLAQHGRQAAAGAAQVQIEYQGHYSPLEVVAHLAVSGIGIGLVELHPGLLAAQPQALHLAAGCEPVAAEVAAQIAEHLLRRADAGGVGEQLIHVAGHPLGEPEAGHHHGLVVVVGHQLGGPQPAHVPLVQVFMGHELQEPAAALRFRQSAAAELEHTTAVVLEAAIAALREVEHKQVVVRGGPLHPHQPATGQTHPLHISHQLVVSSDRIVSGQGGAPAHPAVGDARHREGMLPVGARLNGTVHQLVEVGGQPHTILALGQGHEGAPVRRQAEAQLVGLPAQSLHRHGHGSQAEKTVLGGEVAGAHREFAGHQPVAEGHGLEGWQLRLPGGHAGSLERNGLAALAEGHALKLTHIVADQIGAGGPAGQGPAQVIVRRVQRQLHLHQAGPG